MRARVWQRVGISSHDFPEITKVELVRKSNHGMRRRNHVPAVPFSIHPRILKILGEDLLQTKNRALLELVKNSYDADATTCRVTYDPAAKTLTVADDGHGMTLTKMEKGWMTLGSLEKLKTIRSPGKRLYSGYKGLGRMAVAGLGKRSKITTATAAGRWMTFDFDVGRIRDESVVGSVPTVDVATTTAPVHALGNHGTVIEIEECDLELGNVQNEPQHLQQLLDDLRLLMSPTFGTSDKFAIELIIPGVHDGVLERIEFDPPCAISLKASVLSPTTALIVVERRARVYTGPSKKMRHEETISGKFSQLPGVEFNLRWIPRGHRPNVSYWKDTLYDADLGMNGVHVYRDLVRVQPYGDPSDDWLALRKQSVSMGSLKRYPRPNQVLGWVAISREANPEFDDNPSREGLKNNEAFRQLRSLCQDAVLQLSHFRQEIEPPTKQGGQPTGKPSNEDVKEARAASVRLREAGKTNPGFRKDAEAVEQLITRFEETEQKSSLYRERTSAGVLATLVLHDSGINLKQQQNILNQAADQLCDQPNHAAIFIRMTKLFQRIVGGYDLLRGASRSGAHRQQQFDASQTATEVLNQMELATTRPVTFNRHFQGPLSVYMREADLWSVLVNFLHNAVTAHEYGHARGRTFEDRREINVVLALEGDDLIVEIEDNGPGLPNREAGWIWGRANSTRNPGGSGLGLWMVRDIVQSAGGDATANAASHFQSGARFVAVFPEVGQK